MQTSADYLGFRLRNLQPNVPRLDLQYAQSLESKTHLQGKGMYALHLHSFDFNYPKYLCALLLLNDKVTLNLRGLPG